MSNPHPSLGRNAKRSCTDCWCLIVLALMWGLLIGLAGVALANGDPKRLIKGTDYLGNICGEGSPDLEGVTDWSSRKLLWYPVTYDKVNSEFIVKDALKLGICVSECPSPSGGAVTAYKPTGATSDAPNYAVYMTFYEQFNRCVPNFLSVKCGSLSSCKDAVQKALTKYPFLKDAWRLGLAAVEELRNGAWIVAAGAGISVIIATVWVFCMRWTVKPIVVLVTVLVLVSLIGVGVLCFFQRQNIVKDEPEGDSTAARVWLALAVICWILALLFVCVLLFLGKAILVACDVIEEASKVPIAIPTMHLLPFCLFLFVVPLVAFAGAIAVYVYTSGKNVTINLQVPSVDISGGATIPDLTTSGAIQALNSLSDSSVSLEAKSFEFENWSIYAQVYNLFMFLWSFGLVNAVGYLTFALCCAFWYFSNPGDDKSAPLGSVLIGIGTSVRYHLGSLALGSFIVAVVQLLRILLVFVDKNMKEIGGANRFVQGLMKFLHCCLACLERVLKFINKNAYCVMAISGKNFFASARRGLEIFGGNMLVASATHIIAEVFIFGGKVQITLLSGCAAFLLARKYNKDDGATKGLAIVACVAVIGFLTATLFVSVLSVCIDGILVCYCYDKAEPGNHYCPDDLARYLDKGARAGTAKKLVDENEASEKMLETSTE